MCHICLKDTGEEKLFDKLSLCEECFERVKELMEKNEKNGKKEETKE